MEDKLILLDLAKEFKVERKECTNGFTIFDISIIHEYGDEYDDEIIYSLKCELEFNDKNHLISENYYVTGAYNCGLDSILINISHLERLKKFVQLLK